MICCIIKRPVPTDEVMGRTEESYTEGLTTCIKEADQARGQVRLKVISHKYKCMNQWGFLLFLMNTYLSKESL